MAPLTIPSINFCKENLKPGSAEWESTRKQVFEALKEYGCFEAIYDKMPKGVKEGLFDTLKEALPVASKIREYSEKDSQPYRTPFNEFRHTADLAIPHGIETFVNTFWPHGNPHRCDVIKSYSYSLVELSKMLESMILESLELTHYIDEFMDQHAYSLRVINYKKEVPQGEDVKKPRISSHTDSGFLTILTQDQVGIQFLMKNGDWIQPNVSPNSFMILVGDSLMAWTNGRLPSVAHRVQIAGDTDRFSIMLFTSPKQDCVVEAPKELVDEKHPILFKPYTIVEFYNYIMKTQDKRSLKSFCGV